MIDLANEEVVSLAAATKHLPKRRGGKRPHVSTLYRWATAGVRGIRLEVIRVGSTQCTSLEALQRFCERCTAGDADRPVPTTTKQRRHQQQQAEAELAAAGI